MYIGIECNTDQRYPRTTLTRSMRTESAARAWLEGWEDPPAFPSEYEAGTNMHRRVRAVAVLPSGIRRPSQSECRAHAARHSTPTYRLSPADAEVRILRGNAESFMAVSGGRIVEWRANELRER